MSETRVITPHIDRRWHTIAHLPELDLEFEQQQILDIHRALFLGLLHDIIVWEKVYDDTRIYRYKQAGALSQEFIVSNGTVCDKFYEVLDSLTISPVAVSEILDNAERKMALFMEDQQAAAFEGSPIESALSRGIVLNELVDFNPSFRGRKITLFDVPTFYAISAVKGEYSDGTARDLTANALSLLKAEVLRLEEPSEAMPVLMRVLRDQFVTFRGNVDVHFDATGAQIYRKVRTILRPLGELLEELRMRELLKEVEAFEALLQDK